MSGNSKESERGEREVFMVMRALKTIYAKWKLLILSSLFANSVQRFSDLCRAIPDVSEKVLAQQLRELERDGIVGRTVHPQVPPKVEYWLTESGKGLAPALRPFIEWAYAHEAKQREKIEIHQDTKGPE